VDPGDAVFGREALAVVVDQWDGAYPDGAAAGKLFFQFLNGLKPQLSVFCR
jgi:hypothetical protein